MTKEELKIFVNNTVEDFLYRSSGAGSNCHISQSDFEDVAKPVATLAILNGYACFATYGIDSFAIKMIAYIKSLSFIVKIGGSYEFDMRELMHYHYKTISQKVRDDDLINFADLRDVIFELLREAEQ